MKLKKKLEEEKFLLEVTMPQREDFVQAVLDGGAQALKMRCNAAGKTTHSFGIFNGPFETRKAFLETVCQMAGDVPVGLVPGSKNSFITREQVKEAEEIGIDYFKCNSLTLRPYLLESEKLTHVICTTFDNMHPDILFELDSDPGVDAFEANFLPHEEFGGPFTYQDILMMRSYLRKVHKPVMATAEKFIKPEDIVYLYDEGVKCLMIGLEVFARYQEQEGGELTPDTCKRVTALYRETIERLK